MKYLYLCVFIFHGVLHCAISQNSLILPDEQSKLIAISKNAVLALAENAKNNIQVFKDLTPETTEPIVSVGDGKFLVSYTLSKNIRSLTKEERNELLKQSKSGQISNQYIGKDSFQLRFFVNYYTPRISRNRVCKLNFLLPGLECGYFVVAGDGSGESLVAELEKTSSECLTSIFHRAAILKPDEKLAFGNGFFSQ